MTISTPGFLRATLGAVALSLSASAMAQTETLRIQDYPGLGNMIVRVAASNGYCEKNGLKCELKTIPSGPLGIQTLMAGDIDIAFGPAEVVIQAANKGADLKIKDTQGRTALDCAVQHGQASCAALLRAKGAAGGRKQPAAVKAPKDGDAVVWYLGHSGWAVRTSGHLLVFDYFKGERAPDDPGLAGGAISPAELVGLKTIILVSHGHGDHYMPAVFDWRKDVPDLTYVMGFAPRDKEEFVQLANRETREVAGAEITTIVSNDSGQGFLVKVDGVTILHPGDHANRNRDLAGNYTPEIDFLASKAGRVDIMFVPVTGCNFGDVVAVRTGAYYALRKLAPRAAFPMHAGDGGQQYAEFAAEARSAGISCPIAVARFPGDRWELRGGRAGGPGALAR